MRHEHGPARFARPPGFASLNTGLRKGGLRRAGYEKASDETPGDAMPHCTAVPAFLRDLAFADLPADVVAQAQRCLLDLVRVAAVGSTTQAAAIANTYAATQLCGRDRNARILLDGRRAGIAGAA